MATETTTPHVCTKSDCPTTDALVGLMRGDTPVEITDHIGTCGGCQDRLDALATGDNPSLSAVVRHIDRAEPPKASAYWQALAAAQVAITGQFEGQKPVAAELKLSFLMPSADPKYLGRLAHFEVRRVIGRGGMGVVLQAFDTQLNRDVAIKILDPTLADNDVARQRFCREARAAAAVSHENIVAIYQVNEIESRQLPYIVMQLVSGETLEERLRRVTKLSVPDAVAVAAQAAAGLAAAHAVGLMHRDVKPGNILIESGTDKVRLTDFGLARATEDMKLTRTGFVAGTPLYMAPEQARGDDADARADLFSLGSVLYESLAGRPPFDGKTPLAVLRRIADDNHRPLRRVNPDVPAWLEDIIDRLLEKDPADRFQTAGELADLLALKSCHLNPASGATAHAEKCAVVNTRFFGRRRPKLAKALFVVVPMLLGAVAGGLSVYAGLPPRTVTVPVPTPYEVVKTVTVPGAAGGPGVPAGPVGPAELQLLPRQAGAVWSVAAAADGRTVAVGLEDGHIVLWESTTGKVLTNWAAHGGPVWAVNFATDGKTLMSASDDQSLKIWDLADGSAKELKSLPHPGSVRAAAMHKETGRVMTGDRSGTVRVWDTNDDKPVWQFSHGGGVNAVAFSPTDFGMTVASASTDKTVIVWDLRPGKEPVRRLTLKGHDGPVYGVAFSPDGTRLATASWDESVIIWDTNNGAKLRSIKAHDEGAWSVDFANCGKKLATTGQDGSVKLWDADTGEMLQEFSRHKGTVHVARFTPDCKKLVTGGRDGTARVWAVGK